MVNLKGVTSAALPWARSVESRIDSLTNAVRLLGGRTGDAEKTVFSEFSSGQQATRVPVTNVPINGKIPLTAPVAVRYISTTGLFEVTVSLAGLVSDGAILGASFESAEQPYEVSYDLPRYGVVAQAPVGQTTWKPFSASYSTVISARPGVQDLSLYLYGVCLTSISSSWYVKRARLSVKAV